VRDGNDLKWGIVMTFGGCRDGNDEKQPGDGNDIMLYFTTTAQSFSRQLLYDISNFNLFKESHKSNNFSKV